MALVYDEEVESNPDGQSGRSYGLVIRAPLRFGWDFNRRDIPTAGHGSIVFTAVGSNSFINNPFIVFKPFLDPLAHLISAAELAPELLVLLLPIRSETFVEVIPQLIE